jgi:ubiquinone/menaquinone biosynthesis C-methylase UbiE
MPPVRWQDFFDSHAERYDENVFTKNTIAEADFFLNLFPLAKGARILDVGCGTGRHSIELAKRGFSVTGLDLSTGMLAVAKRKADAAGVSVAWVNGDATTFSLPDKYDAALCVCEGAFGLIGSEDDPESHDLEVLKHVAAALRPGGGFLLTALNAYAPIRRFKYENIQSGAFDPATMIAEYEDDWDLPEGKTTLVVRERLFIAPEVTRMLREAGFRVNAVYGGTAGNWGKRPLSLDEIEMMFVSTRL